MFAVFAKKSTNDYADAGRTKNVTLVRLFGFHNTGDANGVDLRFVA